MRVKEIEELFKQIDTLDLVLEDLVKDMEIVDKWCKTDLSDINDNTEEIKKALNQLSIAYANLRIVLGIAETEYKNREVRYYETKRIEAEGNGVKFVSGATEKEASANVAEYRRIRNILEAYENACNKRITVLQSILKDTLKEQNTNPQEQ